MKNKYRIVTDSYCGYEAQIKYWWFPFVWFQMSGPNSSICNTFTTVETAEEWINMYRRTPYRRKSRVVKRID